MTIENAITEMSARLSAHAEKFKALGFLADIKVYYTDKSLNEYTEMKKGCLTVWCELKISTQEIDADDGLIYELYADIDKNGTDIKAIGDDAKSEIEEALCELYSTLSSSEDAKTAFLTEYQRVSLEFDEKMAEFEKKIKKLRYLSIAAVGGVAVSLIIAFIASLL